MGRTGLVRPLSRRRRLPIRSCTAWGLPCRPGHPGRGALLPHRFTLATRVLADAVRRSVLCGTFLRVTPTGRWPARCPVVLGLSSAAPSFRTDAFARTTPAQVGLARRCGPSNASAGAGGWSLPGVSGGLGGPSLTGPPSKIGDPAPGAQVCEHAARAGWPARHAGPPAMPNHELVSPPPALLGDEGHEVLLHAVRVLVAREPEPARHPAHVRVHRKGLGRPQVHEHHPGGLPAHPGQQLERRSFPGHVGAVLAHDGLHGRDDGAGLVPEEPQGCGCTARAPRAGRRRRRRRRGTPRTGPGVTLFTPTSVDCAERMTETRSSISVPNSSAILDVGHGALEALDHLGGAGPLPLAAGGDGAPWRARALVPWSRCTARGHVGGDAITGARRRAPAHPCPPRGVHPRACYHRHGRAPRRRARRHGRTFTIRHASPRARAAGAARRLRHPRAQDELRRRRLPARARRRRGVPARPEPGPGGGGQRDSPGAPDRSRPAPLRGRGAIPAQPPRGGPRVPARGGRSLARAGVGPGSVPPAPAPPDPAPRARPRPRDPGRGVGLRRAPLRHASSRAGRGGAGAVRPARDPHRHRARGRPGPPRQAGAGTCALAGGAGRHLLAVRAAGRSVRRQPPHAPRPRPLGRAGRAGGGGGVRLGGPGRPGRRLRAHGRGPPPRRHHHPLRPPLRHSLHAG